MSIFASKLSIVVFLLSLSGLLVSGFRAVSAILTKRVRALTKVYSKNLDCVEYSVWFVTYICLSITFFLIVLLFIWRSIGNTGAKSDTTYTHFYTAVILIIQFSALIAFVPFMVRMVATKGKTKGGNSKSMREELQKTTGSLQAASNLLKDEYTLESQNTQNGVTLSTFSKTTNSSALIRIESKGDEIVEIF